MRWVVSLVAAVCLMAAAGSGRADPRTQRVLDTVHRLSSPPPAASHVAQRRDAPRTELRLAPFTLPSRGISVVPPRALAYTTSWVPRTSPAPAPPAPSARGPPRG